jgi:hypothetical protein
MKNEATQKMQRGSSTKTTDEKRGNPKNTKGSKTPRSLAHLKRPPMKKEATPKTQRGTSTNTSDEKSGNSKNVNGLINKDLRWKKRQPQKHKGAHQQRPPMKREATQKTQRVSSTKTSDKKEATQKMQRGS